MKKIFLVIVCVIISFVLLSCANNNYEYIESLREIVANLEVQIQDLYANVSDLEIESEENTSKIFILNYELENSISIIEELEYQIEIYSNTDFVRQAGEMRFEIFRLRTQLGYVTPQLPGDLITEDLFADLFEQRELIPVLGHRDAMMFIEGIHLLFTEPLLDNTTSEKIGTIGYVFASASCGHFIAHVIFHIELREIDGEIQIEWTPWTYRMEFENWNVVS